MRLTRPAGLLLMIAVVTACSSPPPIATPTAETTAVPATSEPTTAALPSATPEAVVTPIPLAALPDPVVTLTSDPIPFVRTLALRDAPIDAEASALARSGVEMYLARLKYWRDDPRQHFPASGPFGNAVREGLAASATPGVRRELRLSAITVERYLVKPWGVPALADVRVTIVDKVIEGSAEDQAETGRLRLLGDRLRVVDGWDATNGRWFNGAETMTDGELRRLIGTNLPWYLRLETWLPGSPAETGFGPGTSALWASRHEYLESFDRSKIVSRTFADLRAKVERYETFTDLKDGLATVLLTGTVVTVDASGTVQRGPFSRRLIVLYGNWGPEVVDEEISAGVWRSGGQLYAALKERDRNFA